MKTVLFGGGLIAMILGTVFIVGCTETQEITVANQAGLVSAVSWISYDNPSPEIKNAVSGVLDLIVNNASLVNSNKTYSDVLYPIVCEYIDKSVPSNSRPVVKIGSVAMLNGIDLMFASNPSWQDNQTLVLKLVVSYCNGAKSGLMLAADSPVIKQAMKSASIRSKIQYGK